MHAISFITVLGAAVLPTVLADDLYLGQCSGQTNAGPGWVVNTSNGFVSSGTDYTAVCEDSYLLTDEYNASGSSYPDFVNYCGMALTTCGANELYLWEGGTCGEGAYDDYPGDGSEYPPYGTYYTDVVDTDDNKVGRCVYETVEISENCATLGSSLCGGGIHCYIDDGVCY